MCPGSLTLTRTWTLNGSLPRRSFNIHPVALNYARTEPHTSTRPSPPLPHGRDVRLPWKSLVWCHEKNATCVRRRVDRSHGVLGENVFCFFWVHSLLNLPAQIFPLFGRWHWCSPFPYLPSRPTVMWDVLFSRISYLTPPLIWWRSLFCTPTSLDITTSTCKAEGIFLYYYSPDIYLMVMFVCDYFWIKLEC